MQIILTIFYVVWLCAVLVFLFLIWRTTRSYIREMEGTVLDAIKVSAEAANRSAEAAAKLATVLESEQNHHA